MPDGTRSLSRRSVLTIALAVILVLVIIFVFFFVFASTPVPGFLSSSQVNGILHTGLSASGPVSPLGSLNNTAYYSVHFGLPHNSILGAEEMYYSYSNSGAKQYDSVGITVLKFDSGSAAQKAYESYNSLSYNTSSELVLKNRTYGRYIGVSYEILQYQLAGNQTSWSVYGVGPNYLLNIVVSLAPQYANATQAQVLALTEAQINATE
jgi:hypothetical protein